MSALISLLSKLNIFEEQDVKDDQHLTNIYATRVFLVLLVVILIGLTLGFWLTTSSTRIIVNNPTIDQFEGLKKKDALCPCSQLNISNGAFIQLEASLHRICSSDFVSDRWIERISSTVNISYANRADFRVTGSAQFLGLAAFCRLSQRISADSKARFYSTSLLSPQVLTQVALELTVEMSIQEFQQTMPASFKSQWELTNRLIFGNKMLSSLDTTLVTVLFNDPNSVNPFNAAQFMYNDIERTDCYCTSDYNCRSPSIICGDILYNSYQPYGPPTGQEEMRIPGFYTGCLPINSLVQSSLECFYDQTCVDQLASSVAGGEHFSAIDLHPQSLFQHNSTVESILNRVMIEHWKSNFSYRDYFDHCKPIYCSYFINERHTAILVLTQIIGLLGGLTLILTLIVPKVVHYIRNRHVRKQSPSEPFNRR